MNTSTNDTIRIVPVIDNEPGKRKTSNKGLTFNNYLSIRYNR